METDDCSRLRMGVHASVLAILAWACGTANARAASTIEVSEAAPGAFVIAVATDVVFDTVIVGVNGDVTGGANLVPVHEQLGTRQLVSASNGLRLLSPLGAPNNDGVFEPGISHDIDLTYGVTNPVPSEWVDGLDSVPFLGFRLLGGPAEAQLQLLFRGEQTAVATVAIHTAVLPGDFNDDGFVTAADYVVWRNGLGVSYTEADYDDWRANFGVTAGAAGGELSQTIPEPSGVTLWMAAWITLALMICFDGRQRPSKGRPNHISRQHRLQLALSFRDRDELPVARAQPHQARDVLLFR